MSRDPNIEVEVTSTVQLTPEAAQKVTGKQLLAWVQYRPPFWVADGKVWQEDQEWRHGSVQAVEVPMPAADRKKLEDVNALLERRRTLARELIDTLHQLGKVVREA